MALPVAGALIKGGFALTIGHIIIEVTLRLLMALGFSIVTYVGAEAAFSYVHDYVRDNINSAGYQILSSVISLAQVDTALSMIFGAMVFKMSCPKGGPLKKLMVTC